ncbi:REP element-mobilizing transposase RayT [Natranaerovirga pectinivora]|uniref:REP element-mobilizing transposase RayT n=1 Tax=Natranaerovirga pectinivora TaxID=682400 RepID=A0A4R3MLW6_9FIRM|nr:transposase [Natranaerovirga pectinivora]TCT12889.1 REP element-mobilizing transposase RayT [Natranaerovirga pectinivora]
MPRCARIKEDGAYYHVMSRSASEFCLFRDDNDKIKYLNLLKKCLDEFNGTLISYCLMDTHIHLLLNPVNADISKFMQKLNLSYASYYNRKYNRRGHVFADRFKSKIITSEQYFLVATLYIHNNPKDMDTYTPSNVHKYRFSSLSYYLGLSTDEFNIVNKNILLSYLAPNPVQALKNYISINAIYNKLNATSLIDDINLSSILSEETVTTYLNNFDKENSFEYVSGKYITLVNVDPNDLLCAVANYFNLPSSLILKEKYNKEVLDYKGICFILLRSFCDLTRKQICSLFGNITVSNVYSLCNRGIEILNKYYNKEVVFDEILSSIS